MVRAVDDVERRPGQPIDYRTQQCQLGEVVARSLQEEHGDFNLRQVLRPLDARLARRMQRKSNEREAEHIRERRQRLRLRGHPPAHRLAAGE